MSGDFLGPPSSAQLQSYAHRSLGRAELGDTLIEFGVDDDGSTTFQGGQRVALGLLTPGGSSQASTIGDKPTSEPSDSALSRHGTILSTGAPAGRNAAELKCLLGNNSAKLRAGTLLLPQPGQPQVTRHDLTELEQAKPRARVEVDIVPESDTCVEGGSMSGRIAIKIRNRMQKESAIMIGGGKLRVVGFESVSNEYTRHMFYQYGAPLSDICIGTEAMYSSRLDGEGFALAREGDYSLRFSLSLPLDGGFGKPKGTLSLGLSLAVRYIAMITIKVKDVCTGKRSISHFYRYCTVWPRLNPALILAPAEKPLCSSTSRGFFMGGSGKVEMIASIHRTHWVAGQRCFVRVSISNNTNKTIKRLVLSLVRSVVVFIPDPSLDASSSRSSDVDQDACQTSTSQKQVAEAALEMGNLGSKGHASAKGWWTGVGPGERCTFMHSILLPSDALTVLRSRLLEVTYDIDVIASAGPLTSDVRVKLPIRIVNFISLDPPPSFELSDTNGTGRENCSVPHCSRETAQQDRPVASRIFASMANRSESFRYDDTRTNYDDDELLDDNDDNEVPTDELNEPELDEMDAIGLGNLSLPDDCDQVVQHAINSARIDSVYGENALRFADLYAVASQEQLDLAVNELEPEQISEEVQGQGEQLDDTPTTSEAPRETSSYRNTSSLRYGPRPNRPRGHSFAARVQEKMDASGLGQQCSFQHVDSNCDQSVNIEDDLSDQGPHFLSIALDSGCVDESASFRHGVETMDSAPMTGSRLLPRPPLSSSQAITPSRCPSRASTLSDSEPSLIHYVQETHPTEPPRTPPTQSGASEVISNSPVHNGGREIRPAPGSNEESPVKKRIREMEERLRALQT